MLSLYLLNEFIIYWIKISLAFFHEPLRKLKFFAKISTVWCLIIRLSMYMKRNNSTKTIWISIDHFQTYFKRFISTLIHQALIINIKSTIKKQLPFLSMEFGSDCFLPISAKERTMGILLVSFFWFWWWCCFISASWTLWRTSSLSWPELTCWSRTISEEGWQEEN